MLRPVEVGEDGFEQARALNEGALQALPLLGADHQRNEIDAPWLRCAGRIGKEIVGNARLAHAGIELLHAQEQRGRVQCAERLQKGVPMRARGAGGVDEFVKAAGRGLIAARQSADRKFRCMGAPAHRRRVLPPGSRPCSPAASCRDAIACDPAPARPTLRSQHNRR